MEVRSVSMQNVVTTTKNVYVAVDGKEFGRADDVLRLCYNTILGVTGLDSEEDFIVARKKHDSSLVKRIEKVRARYRDILKSTDMK